MEKNAYTETGGWRNDSQEKFAVQQIDLATLSKTWGTLQNPSKPIADKKFNGFCWYFLLNL